MQILWTVVYVSEDGV